MDLRVNSMRLLGVLACVCVFGTTTEFRTYLLLLCCFEAALQWHIRPQAICHPARPASQAISLCKTSNAGTRTKGGRGPAPETNAAAPACHVFLSFNLALPSHISRASLLMPLSGAHSSPSIPRFI